MVIIWYRDLLSGEVGKIDQLLEVSLALEHCKFLNENCKTMYHWAQPVKLDS